MPVTQKIALCNMTWIESGFEWILPNTDKFKLRITPAAGTLQPNSTIHMQV